MKYGYFDDTNREYVITTPKTPYPWINYLGCDDFFSLFSNTSGGYCFYKDARLRRLTRYRYNNVPIDNEGRYFYLKEDDDIWSPAWKPVQCDLDKYECRHGLGYSRIIGSKNNIEVTQTSFVPIGFNGEIHRITIHNQSKAHRKLQLFSYIEFCLWDAYDDMTNFQRNFSTGEVEVEGSTIYHKTEYRERRNHYAFYSVNAEIEGFDTDRETFIGLYGNVQNPQVVSHGQSSQSMASGWSPIASHQLLVELEPDEEKNYIFILGYVENRVNDKWEKPNVINKKQAQEMIGRFSENQKVVQALEELRNHWDSVLSKYTVQTKEDKVNRMVNIWNAYQCMVTFNLSRSASFFESGIGRGMGFRDSNQDLLSFVHQIPEKVRQRIIDLAATQLEDGGAYHQYQPLTKKGNDAVGGGFNDDPLWLILAVASYIKETGDWGIMDEQVPFDSDDKNTAPLFDHCKRAFDYTLNHLGPHGLPLIGRADWNDCLNLNCFSQEPGESFQTVENATDGKIAESIFIAGMFVFIGPEYVELCKRKGLSDEADRAAKAIKNMEDTVIRYGFDGEWFLRAYDALGHKIGSRDNDEGQIFIEPQGMCGMAGIGKEEGYTEKALNAAKQYLDTDYGMRLLYPPYSKYYLNLGEITSYPPGYKENAGIFCHNNPWVAIAETVIGRGNHAFEIYKKIAPAYLEEQSDVHRTEPYVYSQMIAGSDAVRHGEAKNSWLTGTASWNYIAITQYILGIRPTYDGLMIDPCIPKEWSDFEAVREFRGTMYKIKVANPYHVSKGVKSLTVDGTSIKGNIIPLCSKPTCEIEVELG